MPSAIKSKVRKLKRPIERALHYVSDAKYRQRRKEILADLERTQREVGAWAAKPTPQADPRKLFAIVSFTNFPLHAKFQCLMAKAMQLRGYTPVILTFSGCKFGHEYFRKFGIDQLIMWDAHAKTISSEAVEMAVKSVFPQSHTIATFKAATFHGVEVGKHALSMTCRQLVEGNLDLSNPSTLGLLRGHFVEAVRSVLATERLLETHPIKKMLVRDAGYIPNGGIFEAALEKGVDCIIYEQGQRRHTWTLKRYSRESKGEHYFSVSSATWDELKRSPWTDEDKTELEREFAGRYRPDSIDDTRRLQTGKKVKPPEEVRRELGLDPKKKTAVIFSHIAWDAAFFYGTCLFEDFEQWLYETVKFVAAECPELNWIVKLHPFNVFKLQRENKEEESELRLLRPLFPLPQHVKILRADCELNTQSLFPVVDYVLTVNGTVGMEFPCFGVPAILAGTGRYDGRGFTIDPATKEEYFAALRDLHKLGPLSAEAIELASRHFLAVTAGRQTSLEDIAPVELKRLHEAQSDVHDNLSITARSLESFVGSPSIRRMGDWMAYDTSPDLLDAKTERLCSSATVR
jgi:hypothetical protein